MESKDKKNNKAILIGVLLIALVFGYTLFKSESGKESKNSKDMPKSVKNYPKISAKDLQKKVAENNAVIVDVRLSSDYGTEHIADSINAVSPDSIKDLTSDKTAVIVGYGIPNEDFSAIFDFLKEKKINSIFVLDGGLTSWKNSGGNTISIGNPGSFIDTAKVSYAAPEDIKKILDNKNYPVFILDVRPKQSFDGGHLAGAVNLSLDDLEKMKDQIPFGKQIFVYGDTELQGFQAGVRLYDLNFLAVKVLKGGIGAWKDKGFPVEK